MTPYPEYKPTGLPWLPLIPKEWEIKKLRHLLSVVSEKGHQEAQLLSVVREKGVILRDKDNKEENHNYVPDDLSNYKFVKTGQFAMNKMKAWQGSYGISQFDGIVSPAYFVFALKGVSADFFHHAIRAQHYVPYFGQASDGIRVGQWDLSIPRMKEIPFCIPSTSEQAQIVRYLDAMTAKINKLIRAKKKEIVLLQEQKQAIINRAVTKGLDPNAEMKDSGIDWIGEIPTHWGKDKIFRLFKLIGSGTTPPNGEKRFYENGMVPWINSGDLYTGRKIISSIQRNVSGYALQRCSALKIFPAGTIFVAMYGASIGNMGISAVPACCNQACCCLALPRINITLDFAFYLLQSCKKYWIEQSNGGGQPNISQEIIKQTWVGIPPESEQKSIVSFLNEKMQKKEIYILQNQKYIESLTEYKNSLISSVVTGQVDVRNIAVEDVSSDDLVWEDDTPALEDPEEEQPTAESEE